MSSSDANCHQIRGKQESSVVGGREVALAWTSHGGGTGEQGISSAKRKTQMGAFDNLFLSIKKIEGMWDEVHSGSLNIGKKCLQGTSVYVVIEVCSDRRNQHPLCTLSLRRSARALLLYFRKGMFVLAYVYCVLSLSRVHEASLFVPM